MMIVILVAFFNNELLNLIE